MMDRPHILCIIAKSPLPAVTGSRVRIKRLVEGLSELGPVTVVVAANVQPAERAALEAWRIGRVIVAPMPKRGPAPGERLRWMLGLGPERDWLYRVHAPVVEVLRKELEQRPDIVWVSGRWVARFLAVLPTPPLVVDMQAPERVALVHDIASMLRRGGLSCLPRLAQLVLDAPARLRAERLLWARASLITPVSEQDARTVPSEWAHKVRVVNNGVDMPEPVRTPSHTPRIVFLGNLNYAPNADAARWIVRDILPRIHARRPDVELRLVGAVPDELRTSLSAPGVVLTGFVEDLRPMLGECAAALLAVRSGAGTKLKVLDALAHGVPVVTTTIGNEGIGTRDGVHLVVRDSAEELAAAIVRVIGDAEYAARLSRDGREFVLRSHGWGHAVAELRAGIELLLGASSPAALQRV